MRIFEHNADGGWLLDAIRRQRAKEAKRRGLHVSTICDDIAKAIEPKRYAKGNFTDAQMLEFQELGNAIEELVARELRRKYSDWHKPDPRQDDYDMLASLYGL